MLLCAPSLGILDSWLPVLDEVRASGRRWRVVALVPDTATLAQLDADDTAHVLADELVDMTVAPDRGRWVVSPGLLAARREPGGRRDGRWWLRSGRRGAAERTEQVDLRVLDDPGNRLLYDIHLHEKPALAALLATLGSVPRHSANHGLILEQRGERRVTLPAPGLEATVFAYGSDEVAAYAENFALPPSRIEVVGVPRHDPAWVDHVVGRSRALHTVPFEAGVFVISRPGGSSYLPRDRKVRALRDLHRVAWEEHGLPLMLRTHPKESVDGSIEEALPEHLEGVSWARTRAHPFHLARHSRLAVAFFSGVVIDTVALGVPTVELLDVRGLPEHDHAGSPRDARGRPMFGPYRADGLVIPADDIADLREVFARVLEDPDATLERLGTAHARRIATVAGAAQRMAERITGGLPGPEA